MTKTIIKIGGMSCKHCQAAVTNALSAIDGVKKVKVDLKKGLAGVAHEDAVKVSALCAAVVEAGFTASAVK